MSHQASTHDSARSAPQALKELMEKQAIAELIYHYAQAIDRRDNGLLASLFTSDAYLHYGMFEGPASKLVAGMGIDQPSPILLTHHHVGNILIRFHGEDRAKSITYLHAVHRSRYGDRLVDEMIRARYLDRLVKQDGRWRFAERTLVYDWSHVAPADAANWWGPAGDKAATGADAPEDPATSFLSDPV